MADFSSLKQTIQTYIKQNGNEDITGNILQDVLLAIVSTMGDSAINGLASALQDETTARQNQDATLQGNITAETMARQQADTALGGRIDGLQTAVNGLQTAINGINTKLAEGYIYAGIATPSTNPGSISGKVFYIAVKAGTYTNFGGTAVAYGINILKYNGSAWSSEQIIDIDDEPTAGSDSLVKSGSVATIRDLLFGNISTEVTLTSNNGFVSPTGELKGGTIGYYTNPISLSKDEALVVYTASSAAMSVFSEYNDGTYTPLLLGNKNIHVFSTYTFVADKDMQVVISGYNGDFSSTTCKKLACADYTFIDNIFKVLDKVPKPSGVVKEATGDFADIHTFPVNTFYQCTNSAVYSQIVNRPEGVTGFGVYTFAPHPSLRNVRFQILQSGNNKLYVSVYWGNIGWSEWINIIDATDAFKIIGSINNSIVAAFDNIVSVGDSLTYSAVFLASNQTRQAYSPWPKVVKKVCGLDEYGIFAISGGTSKSVWARYKDEFAVPQTGKTLCTIYLGTNNWFEDTIETSAPESEVENYRTAWADDYTGCMCKIIQTFINFGAKIILIRPHAGGVYPASEIPEGWTLADTNEVIRKMALRFNIPYIDSADFNPTDIKYHYYPDLSGSNGLHFNDLGYACFAGKFIEEVNKLDTDMMKLLIPD